MGGSSGAQPSAPGHEERQTRVYGWTLLLAVVAMAIAAAVARPLTLASAEGSDGIATEFAPGIVFGCDDPFEIVLAGTLDYAEGPGPAYSTPWTALTSALDVAVPHLSARDLTIVQTAPDEVRFAVLDASRRRAEVMAIAVAHAGGGWLVDGVVVCTGEVVDPSAHPEAPVPRLLNAPLTAGTVTRAAPAGPG